MQKANANTELPCSVATETVVTCDPAGSGGARRHPFFDVVRSTAALLVAVGHLRGYFLPEYAAVADEATIPIKFIYLVTGLQHEAVILFFVVSGFLVGGSAWADFAAGHFRPFTYFVNRFARVYLVLIPGLALILAVRAVSGVWLADTDVIAQLPAQSVTWRLGLCNLACLQGISCSVIVPGAPLWSLSYEWLLYLSAPIVLALAYATAPMFARGAALALLAALAVSLLPAHTQWQWVLIWAFGAAASRIGQLRPTRAALGGVGLAVTVASLLIARFRIWPQGISDLTIGVGFALALTSPSVLALRGGRLARVLADCSYSLYVIHLPVLVLCVALLDRLDLHPPPGLGPFSMILLALMTAALIGISFAFAQVTERYTTKVQRAIAGGLPVQAKTEA